MKSITECKKRVRSLLRQQGYSKTTVSETNSKSEKVFCYYDGILTVIVNNNISFTFGEDKLMECSAHICAAGTDLCTLYSIAEDLFTKYTNGEIKEEDIIKYVERVDE